MTDNEYNNDDNSKNNGFKSPNKDKLEITTKDVTVGKSSLAISIATLRQLILPVAHGLPDT